MFKSSSFGEWAKQKSTISAFIIMVANSLQIAVNPSFVDNISYLATCIFVFGASAYEMFRDEKSDNVEADKIDG